MRPARWAWPALAAGILTLDAWLIANQCNTLSGQFGNAVKHPTWRWIVAAGTIYLNAHLWGRVPDRYDPLTRLAGVLRGQRI